MPHEPFRRIRPRLVRQREAMSCWAAALESWLSVCCPAANYDEAWALQALKDCQVSDHRLTMAGLRRIAGMFGMASEETGPGALTPEYLAARLHLGHLYISYDPGTRPDTGHTVVVWAVGPVTVEVMDPWEGYLSRPFAFFASRSRAFVGWPRYAGGVVPPPNI